jgi:hypothetical protein
VISAGRRREDAFSVRQEFLNIVLCQRRQALTGAIQGKDLELVDGGPQSQE